MKYPLSGVCASSPSRNLYPFERQSAIRSLTQSYCWRFWIGPKSVPCSEPSPTLACLPSSTIAAAKGARKSVVEGKGVSVRVDLGGRRCIKKKKKKNNN